MVRSRFKWKFAPFLYLVLIETVDSLPLMNLNIGTSNPLVTDLLDFGEETRSTFAESRDGYDERNTEKNVDKKLEFVDPSGEIRDASRDSHDDATKRLGDSQLRPGQRVTQYAVEITRDGNGFRGRVAATVEVAAGTRAAELRFHCEGLTVRSVEVGIFSEANAEPTAFLVLNGILRITPRVQGSLFVVFIQYEGALRTDGRGLFVSDYEDADYVAMNLHPIDARRVFPCIDEPTELSTVTFTFTDMNFNSIVSNSMLEENSESQFRPLQGPVHLWGMVAHNLNNVNVPAANVLLHARPGLANQDAQASVAINSFFANLNEWTGRPYADIVLHQDGRMNIFALPDVHRDWYALSTVCIWEPLILMEVRHSARQRASALEAIAEGMSRQWFGFVIFPENWRYQWVVAGLAKYAAFEMLRLFQDDPQGNDLSLLDVNAIFVVDLVHESLLRDAYGTARPMETEQDIFAENEIRDVINGLIRYKAPALLRWLRLILGDESQDFIRSAARALVSSRSLQTVNTLNFYDAINSDWLFNGNDVINNVAEFFGPYVENPGYPLIHVGLRQGGLLLTQEHFSFSEPRRVNFQIPLTYTTRSTADFDNIHPVMVMDVTTTLNMAIEEDDWVLFNLQGQGYYRVNYDTDLWHRILNALNDPEAREEIHEINRATLIDDALNLARAGKLDYDVALHAVLAMEHETAYPAWKAFVRNMDFLRRHLVAMITEDEFLDPDIYLRMIRRTILAFEEEIGFEPEPQLNEPAMVSLTRGLVMAHACRAAYEPCVAAAVDWFYDPADGDVVNPNIPHDIRPAVYCTVVREGDEDVIEMLEERLETEPTLYERIVILEALACSQDEDFIREYLERTIANDSPYTVEERSRIFKAVAESSFENTNAAIAFIAGNTQAMRNMYGGAEKLEEMIFAVANNIASPDQFEQFMIWVNSVNSFLEDSGPVAERARDQVQEDLRWRTAHLEEVYLWIDENDAPAALASCLLTAVALCVALFNY